MMTFNLREYQGKKLVSFIRSGDYAHPGSETAIDLCMAPFDKKPDQAILDVGCGLGKTADYIQHQGYGKVVGTDIEKASIDYARNAYSNCRFLVADAHDLDKHFKEEFNIVTLFNSFYAFDEPAKVLKSIANILKPKGQIAIFEYTDLTKGNNALYRSRDKIKKILPFYPVKIDVLKKEMHSGGWKEIEIINISEQYLDWYASFVTKMINMRNELITKFGLNAFNTAYLRYSQMLGEITLGNLGGSIIYATK